MHNKNTGHVVVYRYWISQKISEACQHFMKIYNLYGIMVKYKIIIRWQAMHICDLQIHLWKLITHKSSVFTFGVTYQKKQDVQKIIPWNNHLPINNYLVSILYHLTVFLLDEWWSNQIKDTIISNYLSSETIFINAKILILWDKKIIIVAFMKILLNKST